MSDALPIPAPATGPTRTPPLAPSTTTEARAYVASQWQLMWWKFRRHKLAIVGGLVVILLYTVALLCEFIAPYDPDDIDADAVYLRPTALHFRDAAGDFHLRPFMYGVTSERNLSTFALEFKEDASKIYPLSLFVHAKPYKLLGLIPTDVHLFGVPDKSARLHLLGTDQRGRDMFSRVVFGARVSLSIGLVGVVLSFILGIAIGGASGYFGGTVDLVVQRVIEFLRAMPTIPLWMSLTAALPPNWPIMRVYLAITIILSLIGWTGLARVVRGRFLALREEDFVMAARFDGCSEASVIFRHMVPSFTSHIIAALTLAVPEMILSETALSFLGLGLRYPAISWGVLLQDAQNIRSVAMAPWLLIPGVAVVIAVLAMNFLGDGLRDAADPYGR